MARKSSLVRGLFMVEGAVVLLEGVHILEMVGVVIAAEAQESLQVTCR
jgi:hypothetical protein